MTLHSVDLRTTGQFPSLLLDYLDQKTSLDKFYGSYPALENVREVIEKKAGFAQEKRQTLVDVLTEQYAGLPNLPDFAQFLDEKTFTVTTGHQLNIFTGPLYIIYKIVTIINLSKKLKEAYPEYNFVPVYWMATEDHDFEEIASFHLFGQTHKWTGEHKGAVGRLNPKELEAIVKQIPTKPLLFAKAYLENNTLADAVRCYMHELFGQYGLVTIDADHREFKKHFLPVIKEELTAQISEKLVTSTTSALNDLGYHTPLHAREINFFYLDDQLRERIVREGDNYKVLNTSITFTETAILEEAENHPEKFSPNVILRPLYEETILPNLAYIGGPSEVPYWLQLKKVFDHFETPFPMLFPRNFAMYINMAQQKKAQKLKIDLTDLFLDEVALRKIFIQRNSENVLDLNAEKADFEQLFDRIAEKAVTIDQTMLGAVKAEQTRLLNSLKHLEKRIARAEERNHQLEIDQLLGLKNKLFPNGIAQERYDNLLNFYISDPAFIQKLVDTFDPFGFHYHLLVEE